MGATHVTVTIRNPAAPDRCWEGLFLVDTGATDSLVPRPHLEAIGLEPKGRRVYELADGNEISMDIAVGEIEFMGETVDGTILFGAADAEPPAWRDGAGIGRDRGRSAHPEVEAASRRAAQGIPGERRSAVMPFEKTLP